MTEKAVREFMERHPPYEIGAELAQIVDSSATKEIYSKQHPLNRMERRKRRKQKDFYKGVLSVNEAIKKGFLP